MSFLTKGYEELWKAIIRPPKETYMPEDLGPTEFAIDDRNFKRSDFQLSNHRSLHLQCSHFEPIPEERVAERLPCVIYLHGNSSSRLEALSIVPVLLPANITVFCLDTSGSGISDGEYISLGWYERDDLACVVDHLRRSEKVTCIGLWGRSMGAVTALLHGDRDPSIAGMVIDSPFSNLRVLSEELARMYAKNVPGFMLSAALSMIRKTVKKKAKFDINELDPLKHVDMCFIPALFCAGKDDTFINPRHTQILYEKYAGDKNLIMVDGDHNSMRPQFLLDSAAIFFYNTLQCDQLPPFVPSNPRRKRRQQFSNPNQNAFAFAQQFQDNLLSDEELLTKAIEESLKIEESKEKQNNEQ